MNKSEKRIHFWKQLWNDLISNFLKKPTFGLKLYNPHILIEDIISEIEDNSFKNPDNKSFFYKQLNYYMNKDLVIKTYLTSKFNIARRNFEPNKSNYLLEILKELKESFSTGFYFEKNVSFLSIILLEESDISQKFIDDCNYISQVLIIEFMKKKYVLEDIIKFPEVIFESYEYDEGKLVTNFPHGLHYENYEKVDQNFYDDVKLLIENLTIEKRIKSLLNIYHKKTKKSHYIFVVEGLKGFTCIEIAGVTFYSIDKKRFTKTPNNPNFDEEDLQIKKNENGKFLQAAVEVDFLTIKSSLFDAVSKLENALDIISCYYNTKTPLEIDTSRYLAVKDDGSIYWSWGTDHRMPFQKHHDSLDIEMLNGIFHSISEKSFLWKSTQDKTILKIKNAAHWSRKAQESKKDEDKLLNYWISIENLFTDNCLLEILDKKKFSKIHLIQEVISSNQIFSFIYTYGWELYWHYDKKFHKLLPSQKISIPDELVERANFNRKTGEKIYLKKFIDCLDDIEKYESNPFYIEQINLIRNFYKNPVVAKSFIENQINQIQDDLLMIYRLRNLIVHNAHFDNTLLKYYVWIAQQLSDNFLRSVIKNIQPGKTLKEIIFTIHFKRDHFLNNLDKEMYEIFEQ